MTKLTPPQPEDYRAVIAQAIREARLAIRQALGYIRRQEDGPVTMHHALKRIDKRVTDIELEVAYLSKENERLQTIAKEACEQRDEAMRQRDEAMRLVNHRKKRLRRRRR